ncbi:NADH dehydrogenase [ubiquinone] 1 alpha subcomplex assembly factor 8 [Dasypus novemcinctus]|uniref:NADH dehydrogenase [ubiquinone] 1 alpha subcomplex assembly factor 8 n=1 Tax=Dasypus novemcinctus TaxID=9361 RepID=UPI00032918EE|nr:NADH dehydrogenase [ubiquinone] 1 alpha subcomplex assembly factor 8 isoform X2 [Dasypus novemcinctus]
MTLLGAGRGRTQHGGARGCRKEPLMSTNGALWGRVRSRLRAFPGRLAACGAEAAAYGRCVQASTAPGGRLRKDLCAQEFEALRSCFAAAVEMAPKGGRQGRP